ncbi:MAG: O-antigen ligase family protein [Legionellaceae bacterium]|nr:O-antigen ligase family protein [Legionellaceae bacterium]
MQNIIIRIQPLILLLLCFCVPLSTTLKSILLPITILTILLNPECRRLLPATLKAWPCLFAMALSLWILVACLYSPAPWAQQQIVLGKILKILCLPLFAVGFYQSHTRKWAIYCFLAAMFLVTMISFYKYYQWITNPDIDPGWIFHDRIMTGLMVAMAAWIAADQARYQEKLRRWIFICMAIVFSVQILLVNTSRTGHISYLILMGLFVLNVLTWRQALTCTLFLFILVAAALRFSPILQNSLHQTIEEISYLQNGEKDTSIGYRFQFHDYARSLFQQKPYTGHGTGAFAWHFQQDNPIPTWGERLFEPHSQYWLIAVESGGIGLALLLTFWVSLLFNLWQLRPMPFSIGAALIVFYLANLSDSLLLYSATGYLFLLFAALAVAEHREQKGETERFSIAQQLPLARSF